MTIFDFEPDTERDATERQIDFINSLRTQFEEAAAELAQINGTEFKAIKWGELPTTMAAASDAIERGREAVGKIRAERNEARNAKRNANRAEVTEGMWIETSYSAPLAKVYKVQKAVHGSGKLYAKVWDTESESFEYLPGGLQTIAATCRPMELAEAKEFGHLYGTCCVCGRTLTDENSIKEGIGPVCAKKF